MITLDTSALLALLDRKEPEHERVKAIFLADRAPYLVPVGILAEVAYMIETLLGFQTLELFLLDLEEEAYALVPVQEDLPRIRALVKRYADLPLGFADACVLACAERHGGRVLSLDRRHFGAVAREGTVTLL